MSEGNEGDLTDVQDGRSEKKRLMPFSMRELLLAPLILVVFVGLAVVIQAYALGLSYHLFGSGIEFQSSVHNWMSGVGVPDPIVRCVSLAIIYLPGWVALALMTLFLGLRRSRHAHFLAWLLALAFPLHEVVLHAWTGDTFEVNMLLSPIIRIVSAFGFVVGMGAWFAGWWIRGRHYDPAMQRRPTWVSRSVQIAVWSVVLLASGYGWAILAEWR